MQPLIAADTRALPPFVRRLHPRSVAAAVVVCALFLLPRASLGQEPIQLATDPTLSPDGATLAFAWRGDLWAVSAEGGTANRLTTDPGRDSQPHFSTDGSRLAFVSDRSGSPQLYVISAAGGAP